MARIDPTKISDRPLESSKPVDPRSTDWYRFSQDIEDLLATGKYTFAEETLRGIQETVEKRQAVTEGQRRAVRNIEASADRPSRGRSRRYEGYNRPSPWEKW